MKTNKQFINDIYNKYDEYTKEKQDNQQKYMRKIMNMAAVVIVLISSIIVFSEKDTTRYVQDNHIVQMMEADMKLQTVGSFENFYEIIKSKNTVNDYTYSFDDMAEDVAKAETTNEVSSKTNAQVENVDESDIVKVDGNYIYYVTNNKIVILDAQNAENSSKIAEISYEEENKFNPREIYVKNNKLIVIGNETGNYTATCKVYTEESTYDVAGNPDFKTGMILYDISNKKEPKEIRRVMVQGNYMSSRMIGDNIYFVANQYLYTYAIARNELKDLNENDYKPKYLDTAVSEEEKYIDYDGIYSLDSEDTNYLILAGLNLENNEEADIKTFLGAGQYVYASEKNMYIATNKQNYGEGDELLGGTTHILKFSLENGKFIFKAKADIEGQVNNQFSMDENEEYFRIATTSGNIWNINENTKNNLYVLNDKLEKIGEVAGFAPDEKIYSVRYVGDKAYVVTFKQTDPLFVIDLSNPENPQILGELKLPGYSTYLHPYDETHLIGFGYETKEDGTRVTTDGLKMVMFDISDFTNPQVLFKVKVGDSKYTYSQLLYNHKALLFSKEKNIIAFPLYSSSGTKTNSRAAIYEIDLNQGFVLKGEIAKITNDYLEEVERIVFVNGYYYTLSKGLVKVANMETLEVVKEIEL